MVSKHRFIGIGQKGCTPGAVYMLTYVLPRYTDVERQRICTFKTNYTYTFAWPLNTHLPHHANIMHFSIFLSLLFGVGIFKKTSDNPPLIMLFIDYQQGF